MSTGEQPSGERRRVCLLTGAGGLLGSAFCARHAATYDIVAVWRTRRPAVPSQYESYVDPLAPDADVAQNRASVFAVQADLTKDGDIDRVVELAIARFGGIDLLVNNAATASGQVYRVVDGDSALRDLDRQLQVNVAAPLRLAVRVAQAGWFNDDLTNRARNRNVVNISSVSATEVYPHQGQAVYAASKAALNQLTLHLAAEFATFGVRVNALSPDRFPGRVRVEDVADGIAALDSGADTGRIVVMAGADPAA